VAGDGNWRWVEILSAIARIWLRNGGFCVWVLSSESEQLHGEIPMDGDVAAN
jgi:hypothetical protein